MVNKVTLIGNVGKDPETKVFENSDTQMSRFTLATSKKYKKGEEVVEETQWHNLVVWRGLSKVVDKWVKKGDKIYIEGEIQYRKYDDKDGVTKYVTEIQVSELKLLGQKSENKNQQASSTTGEVDGNKADADEDDLPF